MPVIKNAIRTISIVEATALAKQILTLTTAQEILDLLVSRYRETLQKNAVLIVKIVLYSLTFKLNNLL